MDDYVTLNDDDWKDFGSVMWTFSIEMMSHSTVFCPWRLLILSSFLVAYKSLEKTKTNNDSVRLVTFWLPVLSVALSPEPTLPVLVLAVSKPLPPLYVTTRCSCNHWAQQDRSCSGPPLYGELCPDWIKWSGIPKHLFYFLCHCFGRREERHKIPTRHYKSDCCWLFQHLFCEICPI